MIVRLCNNVFVNTEEIAHVKIETGVEVTFTNGEYIHIGDRQDIEDAKQTFSDISIVNLSRLKSEAYDLKQCIKFKKDKLKSEGHKHD